MGNELCKYLQELLLGGVATDFSEIVAIGQERGCCNQFWVGKSTLKPPDAARPKLPGLSRPFRDGWQLCALSLADSWRFATRNV